jgi:hypothetical protein
MTKETMQKELERITDDFEDFASLAGLNDNEEKTADEISEKLSELWNIIAIR